VPYGHTSPRVTGSGHILAPDRLPGEAVAAEGTAVTRHADRVLVVVGVQPGTSLAADEGAGLGACGAIAMDRQMRTGLPGTYAAGNCDITRNRLLGETCLALGTTAHKQGWIAGRTPSAGTGVRRQPRHPGRQADRYRHHRHLPRHDRRSH
jgi:hypothetical protein